MSSKTSMSKPSRMNEDVDATDRNLIELLRKDGRQPILALARALRVSRSTVQDRLARLVREGIIKRFTIELAKPVEPTSVRAFLMIRIEGRPCARMIPSLMGFPEVESCHHVSGPMDVLLSVRVANLAALNELRERIGASTGILSVTAVPVLRTHLDGPM
ncbi:Lrp/AsnC family transcriptional regulator [Pendulispora brunnea]|uniref:Lrp/AsnC family transcriptional regulator n=1 Tax=Pendulispora brunnea TaxID=2905690 RepID=A0ABZ2KPE5_9BACT